MQRLNIFKKQNGDNCSVSSHAKFRLIKKIVCFKLCIWLEGQIDDLLKDCTFLFTSSKTLIQRHLKCFVVLTFRFDLTSFNHSKKNK